METNDIAKKNTNRYDDETRRGAIGSAQEMATKEKTVSAQVPYFGLTKFLVLKLALPHICLWSLATLYCVGGAFVFMQLEGKDTMKANQLINRLINLTANELVNLTSGNEQPWNESNWRANGNQILDHFFIRTYQLHRRLDTPRSMDSETEKWAFARASFFTATTLTSIGYGNQTPSTRYGKVFCIFYALFGLPLIVITVADIAKFISHFITGCYIKYAMVKWRIRSWYRHWSERRAKRRASLRRGGLSLEETDELNSPAGDTDEDVAEFLWVNLVNAEFVEIPAILMFTLILGYVSLGGYYFQSVEGWTFFEGFYFSLISILAVGFGDFTPRNERYIYVSLVYVLFGIILTTTCIDIVGVDYINKLHFWGRKLDRVDPLMWLKQVQERRLRNMKKKAMVALFNTLTALHYMRLDPSLLGNMKTVLEGRSRTEEAQIEKEQEKSNLQPVHESTTAVVAKSPRHSIRMPPNTPRNLRATSISVHSVTLTWEAPVSGVTEDMYYSLSYRLRTLCETSTKRHGRRQSTGLHGVVASSLAHGSVGYPECMDIADTIDDLSPRGAFRLAPRRMGMTGIERISGSATSFTVNGLKSFAFYQFSLTAVNKSGRGRPIRTQEYTEPSTVPLNIRAASVSDTMAKVVWDPPARNKLGPRRYTLHLTSDSNKPFAEWHRIEASTGEHQLSLSNLEPMTTYVICVSANHNRGLAVLSRSLTFSTAATPVDDQSQ